MKRIKVKLMRNKDGEEYEMHYNELAKGVWEWDGSEPTGYDVDTNTDEVIESYMQDAEDDE